MKNSQKYKNYVPPHDSGSAVEFLHDIGVDDGKVNAEAVAAKFENMISFDKLKQQGAVQWGGDILDGVPPPDFRMIPEWEPMAGVLFNWPTLSRLSHPTASAPKPAGLPVSLFTDHRLLPVVWDSFWQKATGKHKQLSLLYWTWKRSTLAGVHGAFFGTDDRICTKR